MKTISKIIFITVLCLGLLLTFGLIGCKQKAVQVTAGETTAAATTAAETATAETTAAETVMEDMDVVDPWITEMRAVEAGYYPSESPSWKGVFGENPVYDKDLILTKNEVKQIKEGNYKVAIVWNDLTGEYSASLFDGIKTTVQYLGMELVATTNAEFDAAKQKSDVETVLALKPDVIVGYPVDLATGSEIFRPVVDAGVKLVFVSNRLGDYVHGKDFVGNSTMDPYGGGYMAAKMLVEGVEPDAEVAVLTADFDYFVLNKLDEGAKDAIKELGPGLTLYEDKYVDYNECSAKAQALLQKHPDIKAFWGTWFDPGLAIAAGLREINNKSAVVYTAQVNVPCLLELLQPDGYFKGISSDFPWNIGMNAGIMCGYAVLGKTAPEMVIVPAINVNADNVRELWGVLMRNIEMPKPLDDALKALGK